MNGPKFQLFKSTTKSEHFYRLRSAKNEIILNGEGYTTKQACLTKIAIVKANAPYDGRYERKDGNNNYTFNLKAANGEIIGCSEKYITAYGRENGIKAVKGYAPSAPIEDFAGE